MSFESLKEVTELKPQEHYELLRDALSAQEQQSYMNLLDKIAKASARKKATLPPELKPDTKKRKRSNKKQEEEQLKEEESKKQLAITLEQWKQDTMKELQINQTRSYYARRWQIALPNLEESARKTMAMWDRPSPLIHTQYQTPMPNLTTDGQMKAYLTEAILVFQKSHSVMMMNACEVGTRFAQANVLWKKLVQMNQVPNTKWPDYVLEKLLKSSLFEMKQSTINRLTKLGKIHRKYPNIIFISGDICPWHLLADNYQKFIDYVESSSDHIKFWSSDRKLIYQENGTQKALEIKTNPATIQNLSFEDDSEYLSIEGSEEEHDVYVGLQKIDLAQEPPENPNADSSDDEMHVENKG